MFCSYSFFRENFWLLHACTYCPRKMTMEINLFLGNGFRLSNHRNLAVSEKIQKFLGARLSSLDNLFSLCCCKLMTYPVISI
jgi:hypothetical protein